MHISQIKKYIKGFIWLIYPGNELESANLRTKWSCTLFQRKLIELILIFWENIWKMLIIEKEFREKTNEKYV